MSQLNFDDWNKFFTPDDGVLPDGVIMDTTKDNWQQLLDVVKQSNWRLQFKVDNTEVLEMTVEQLQDQSTGKSIVLEVFPESSLQLNFFYANTNEYITFDFDRRTITDQASLDSLLTSLQTLSNNMSREIRLLHEGDDRENYFYKFNPTSST